MPLSVIAGLACIASGAALLAAWKAVRSRVTPEKRERRRRLEVNVTGRLGDAMIAEFRDDTLYYTYEVRGVQYEASQEVANLRDCLPADPERLIGPVGMKYSQNNPANSILVCEEWSGLRVPRAKGVSASTSSTNGNAVGH